MDSNARGGGVWTYDVVSLATNGLGSAIVAIKTYNGGDGGTVDTDEGDDVDRDIEDASTGSAGMVRLLNLVA